MEKQKQLLHESLMKFNKSNYSVSSASGQYQTCTQNGRRTHWGQPCREGCSGRCKAEQSQQCVLKAQEASHILGCPKRVARKLRAGILPLYSVLVRPCLVSSEWERHESLKASHKEGCEDVQRDETPLLWKQTVIIWVVQPGKEKTSRSPS